MSNSEIVLQALILFVSKAEALGALYRKAKAENRDVSDAELDALSAQANSSGDALQAWIDAKKSQPGGG
jgi:hypothetical protein